MVVQAVNSLKIKSLLDLMTRTVANMMKVCSAAPAPDCYHPEAFLVQPAVVEQFLFPQFMSQLLYLKWTRAN